MLIHLGLSAVAAFLAALVLLNTAASSFLAAAHLVFAVGILPLIFGAITHFIPVLTRSGKAHRVVLLAPLLLQLAGAAVFLHFQGLAGRWLLHAAAGCTLLIALLFAGWLLLRAKRTLGKPHPGWRWYLAAIACLSLSLLLVPLMAWWPTAYHALRLLHLHLNTLGFIGLTAIGTLQVLLPTVLSGPDAEAAARLRSDLPFAAGGVLAVALGSAFWLPLAMVGAVLLLAVGLRLGVSWWRRYGWRKIASDGASAALAAALAAFLLLIVLGMAHGFALLRAQDAVPAFVAAFLLPLVTGALSQLLPVWRCPGPRSPLRERMRAVLTSGGAWRSLFFVAGGLALAAGFDVGFWLAAVGLLSFLFGVVRAMFSAAKAD
ncbi:MAG: hypothetical protein WAZ34_03960 [Rhodocyclaceae bacterium]